MIYSFLQHKIFIYLADIEWPKVHAAVKFVF